MLWVVGEILSVAADDQRSGARPRIAHGLFQATEASVGGFGRTDPAQVVTLHGRNPFCILP